MEKLFLITVDCDLRCDDVNVRQQSLDALLDAFGEAGAGGHTTWFLNENDFALTRNHESVLREALRRGDTLGVHDHIDFLKGRWEYEPIREYCQRSRETVRAWLRANGYPDAMPYHRAGCLFQRPVEYAVLRDLGYTVLSDVYPGDQSENHTGFLSYDNRDIPFGIPPWRHDPENFLEYTSRKGCFLHVPVLHMYVFTKGFVGDTLALWEKAYCERGLGWGAMAWCFHPYEILNHDKTGVAPDLLQGLREQLRRLVGEYGVTYASLAETAQHCHAAGLGGN